jgi:hypothetical protein
MIVVGGRGLRHPRCTGDVAGPRFHAQLDGAPE